MRVYVPLTLSVLASVKERREVGPAPLTAYTVTPALRELRATDDMEELEYEALGRAAHASLRLLATERRERGDHGEDGEDGEDGEYGEDGEDGEDAAHSRRVVVAVDVDEGLVASDPEGERAPESVGAVRLDQPVPLARVAAFHVDDADAARDVHAACAALASAAQGDQDTRDVQRIVADVEDHELLWYATQELAYLP